MLSIIMLSVIMLSVIMLSVVMQGKIITKTATYLPVASAMKKKVLYD